MEVVLLLFMYILAPILSVLATYQVISQSWGICFIYGVSLVSLILILIEYYKYKHYKYSCFVTWDIVMYFILLIPVINVGVVVWLVLCSIGEYFLMVYEEYISNNKPNIKCVYCNYVIDSEKYYAKSLGNNLNCCPNCNKEYTVYHTEKLFKHYYEVKIK